MKILVLIAGFPAKAPDPGKLILFPKKSLPGKELTKCESNSECKAPSRIVEETGRDPGFTEVGRSKQIK